MKLELHMIVATASQVIKDPGIFVDLHDAADFKWVIRQCGEKPSTQVVQVKVFEPRPLRTPDESLAVLQELHGGRVFGPAWRPLFPDDYSGLSRRGVASRELHDVLSSVGAIEKQFGAVLRPGHVINVVADYCVIERLSVPDIHCRGFFGCEVVDEQISDWIVNAGFWIGLDIHFT